MEKVLARPQASRTTAAEADRLQVAGLGLDA